MGVCVGVWEWVWGVGAVCRGCVGVCRGVDGCVCVRLFLFLFVCFFCFFKIVFLANSCISSKGLS